MTDEELRLECLRLAVQLHAGTRIGYPITFEAESLFEHVRPAKPEGKMTEQEKIISEGKRYGDD